MELYKIKILGHQYTKDEEWGSFKARKTFNIVKPMKNNKTEKITYVESDVSGFIVQQVTKKTEVYALCKDNIHKKITNIDKFTNNQVQFMNHTYTELFPVIDGKSVYSDIFSNGQVLRYEFDDKDKKWHANNNPPTYGTIIQEGTIYFIPDEKKNVEDAINTIKSITNSSNITKIIKIKLLDLEWSISQKFPTNNLPYIEGEKAFSLLNDKKSYIVTHLVIAKWNAISRKINNTIKNNVNSGCPLLNETKVKIKTPITNVSSVFKHLNL